MNPAEIIEKVADVVFYVIEGDQDPRQVARDAILATLDAIREPSEEMIETGEDALLRQLGGADLGGFFSAAELACEAWHAMIDALKREVAG